MPVVPFGLSALPASVLAPYDLEDLQYLVSATLAALLTAIVLDRRKASSIIFTFFQELFGTAFMICCVFPPSPLLGHLSPKYMYEWPVHGLGVIVSDFIFGGPQVNAACTFSLWIAQLIPLTQAVSNIFAQLLGGVIGFPLAKMITLAIRPKAEFGGPTFTLDESETPKQLTLEEAFANEFAGVVLLMCAVYGFCLTKLGKRYLLKQSLVAASIRFILHFYPKTGPAMNPGLGSMYHFFISGRLHRDASHYYVYWLAPFAAGGIVALFWSGATETGLFAAEPSNTNMNSKADNSGEGKTSHKVYE
eukprot:jgi/Bigna1/88733/estExt_fgenesh1_pg.C_370074